MLIAERFLRQFAKEEHKAFTAFTPEVQARLLSYRWPGNVRQLQNVVRNVVVLHDGKIVTPDMLPVMDVAAAGIAPIIDPVSAPISAPVTEPVTVPTITATGTHAAFPGLPTTVDAIEPLTVAERRYIEHAIAVCGGNLQLASRKLKISASTIY